MTSQFFLLLWSLLVAGTSAKLIDLSHDHGPDTIMSPHVPQFNRSTIFSGEYLPGIYVEGGQYSTGEHGGTHMDAPVHFQAGGKRIHQLALENTIAEGVMIDCSAEAEKYTGYIVPLQKILDWEKEHGPIPMEAAVIFNFGWSSKFNNPNIYLGTDTGDQFKFVFPSVSPEAGFWLYDNRNIKIIGTDTLSPDPFTINGKKVAGFPIHQRYLPNSRLIIENLRWTEKLPPTGFRFHAAPVKLVGATGTQVRAYAMTYDENVRCGTSGHHIGHSCMFLILCICSIIMSFGH